MIEEPVAKASENSTNPNSAVAQSVRSALKPGQVHAEDGRMGEELQDEVAVGNGVHAVRAGAVESEIPGERRPVDGERGPGQGRGSERHDVDPREAPTTTLAVARQHEHVREQVVGEQDRLGALQMRVPGHRAVRMRLGAFHQRSLRLGNAPVDAADDVAEVQPLIERDLVVPGASCVELAAHRTHQVDESALDVHVDVFEFPPEGEGPALELGPDGFEPVEQGRELVPGR